MAAKEKPLSREDAKQLYQDMQKSVELLKNRKSAGRAGSPQGGVSDQAAREIAMEIKAALRKDDLKNGSSRGFETVDMVPPQFSGSTRREMSQTPAAGWPPVEKNRGPVAAISFIAVCAALKMAFSILEYSGVLTVQPAEASYQMQASVQEKFTGQSYSPQELQILTSLDARRAELEKKNQQIDEREKELEKRDREFAGRMTELRELSNRLKLDREKTEKKQTAQLTQLANVYNSMNPNEAAQLLDQLDEVTSLSLLEHMSEKRIGQILPLMSPERALGMTRLLSGKR